MGKQLTKLMYLVSCYTTRLLEFSSKEVGAVLGL